MVLWIFGYGSVMWTRDFRYEGILSGYVKDYKRVLAECGDDKSRGQGSANWGLALEWQAGAVTRGVAYRVAADVEQEILRSYSRDMTASGNSCHQPLVLDFFTPSAPHKPTVSGVMTYITPPVSSRLWYPVLQDFPQSRTDATEPDLFTTRHLSSCHTSKRRQSCRKKYQRAIADPLDSQC